MAPAQTKLAGTVAQLAALVGGDCFVPEAFLLKALTRNDDSGRHGVLIPREAYALFPALGAEVAAGDWNPRKPIATWWRSEDSWKLVASKFIHYNRYPERRITSLLPAQVNQPGDRLMLVAKAVGAYEYRCVVALTGTPDWDALHGALGVAGLVEEGSFRLLSAGATTGPSPVFDELLARLRGIAALGWVRTVRAGDTGVGMTLESLLGVPPNASGEPDYKGIELKAKRSGTKATGRRTLFAKTPEWGQGGRGALLQTHGSLDVNGRFSIYQSIYAHRESKDGWRLAHDPAEQRLWVMRHGQRVVSWRIETLAKSLETKHRETVFVYAESRGKGAEEEFRFTRATHALGADIERLLRVFEDGQGCHDFAIHQKPDGSVRDHGFLFRVEDSALPEVFQQIQSIDLESLPKGNEPSDRGLLRDPGHLL